MSNASESIKAQLTALEQNLRLIEERVSEYPTTTEVPLLLEKQRRQALQRLQELRSLWREELRREFGRRFETAQLLPYLPDRALQDDRLGEPFETLQPARPERPVVCLVQGDVDECHEKYLERIQHRTLCDVLGLDPEADDACVPQLHYLRWPANPLEPARELLRQMAGMTLPRRQPGRTAPTAEAVQASLATLRNPVIMATVLAADSWQTGKTEAYLAAHLRFWNQWPALVAGQVLVIILAVKSKRASEPARAPEAAERTRAIQGCFEGFRAEDFERLTLNVLPPFASIPSQCVEDWARNDVPRFQGLINVDTQRLIHRVTQLYEDWENSHQSRAIPLKDLAEQLEAMLAELAR